MRSDLPQLRLYQRTATSKPIMSQAARRGNGPASATGKNGRKLGFPMMSPHEVYSCLSLLGINCQMDDLTRPTPASTRAIWAGLLEILCGINQSQFENPKNTVLGMMEYKVSCASELN